MKHSCHKKYNLADPLLPSCILVTFSIWMIPTLRPFLLDETSSFKFEKLEVNVSTINFS
jgi:hypothetical protein